MIDRNDNTPTFSQDEYRFSVAENADQISGLNVSASDPDDGRNGMIVYTILEGNEEAAFVLGKNFPIAVNYCYGVNTCVDASSGEITRNASVFFDFERTRMYTLNVSAEDMGDPSNLETVLVLIQIIVCMTSNIIILLS